MTAFKVVTAAAALWSILLIAATQRDASPPVADNTIVQRWLPEDAQQSTGKTDRLPLFTTGAVIPAEVNSVGESQLRLVNTRPEPRARAHRHRARDICRGKGRRYFHIGRHVSWRCRR